MSWVKCLPVSSVRRKLSLAAAFLVCAVATFSLPARAQTYTILHNFTGGANGYYPSAGLTLNGTSNLFGGAGNTAVFRLQRTGTSWIFTPIYQFNGTDGDFLAGRVTFGPGGALYGASLAGGIPDCLDGGGCGLVFAMRPTRTVCKTTSCDWTETSLYQFNPVNRPRDGYEPNGGLVFDSSGNVYGTTELGAEGDAGAVFMLSPSQGGWSETNLYNFQYSGDGAYPRGNLAIDQAGNVIGTTETGGASDSHCTFAFCGVVFELTHTSSGWVESVLHTFIYATDGGNPSGGLIADAEGNLYGGTGNGGVNGGGTVYELSPSNGGYTFQVLYSFAGSSSQSGPVGILALDSSGNLYGATGSEGAVGMGSVFKLTHSGNQWLYTDLHDFAGGTEGLAPADGPTLDPSGNLYGTAGFGGSSNNCPGGCGVIWEITP